MKMATDLCSCKRLGFSGTLKGEFPPNAGSSKSSWEAHQTLQGAGFLMSLLGLGIKPATFHAKNSEPVRLQAKWQCYDAYARASTSGCEGRACKESIFGHLCISLLYIVVPVPGVHVLRGQSHLHDDVILHDWLEPKLCYDSISDHTNGVWTCKLKC